MDKVQTIAETQLQQIIDLIGPEGLIAIFGSIFMVRAVRVLWNLSKKESFLATMLISGVIGALASFFLANAHGLKLIILNMQFHLVYIFLLFAMILAVVKAKDVQVLEMLDFSEFL